MEGSGINEVGIDKLNKKILIKIDKRYLRPNEIHNLQGDSSKALNHFKWKFKYTFKTLVKEMIEEELKNMKIIKSLKNVEVVKAQTLNLFLILKLIYFPTSEKVEKVRFT